MDQELTLKEIIQLRRTLASQFLQKGGTATKTAQELRAQIDEDTEILNIISEIETDGAADLIRAKA